MLFLYVQLEVDDAGSGRCDAKLDENQLDAHSRSLDIVRAERSIRFLKAWDLKHDVGCSLIMDSHFFE